MATSNLMLLHVPRNGTAKTTIYRIIQYAKKSRKSGGWQSRYCVWLQSGTRRGGVPLHEAEIEKDHQQTAEKSDMIAYHLRQSFKAGEITPEKANRLG